MEERSPCSLCRMGKNVAGVCACRSALSLKRGALVVREAKRAKRKERAGPSSELAGARYYIVICVAYDSSGPSFREAKGF